MLSRENQFIHARSMGENKMTMPDIPWKEIWEWISNSQLFSTVVILGFGTFGFNWWTTRQESRRANVRQLLHLVEEYAANAEEYWTDSPGKEKHAKRRLCAIAFRLKNEYSVMCSSLEVIKGLRKADKAQYRKMMDDLWESATDGFFESKKRFTDEHVEKRLNRISLHSSALRRSLKALVA